jgi:hypothetical protein
MFRKAILAVGAAALLSAGSIVATPTEAAAAYYGFSVEWGGGYHPRQPYGFPRPPIYQPRFVQPYQQVCRPVYRTVRVWRPYYGWCLTTVYSGQTCWKQRVYQKRW